MKGRENPEILSEPLAHFAVREREPPHIARCGQYRQLSRGTNRPPHELFLPARCGAAITPLT